MSAPVRVAVVSAHQLTHHGIEKLLDHDPGRVTTVDLVPSRPTVAKVEVIAYDAVGLHDDDDGVQLRRLVQTHVPVIAVAPHFRPDLATRAVAAGAAAVVTFAVTSKQLTDIVVALSRRDPNVSNLAGVHATTTTGMGVGLTPREEAVLELVARGLNNAEIAKQLHLSMNTVKTYIRTAYRKIGTTSRTQAVLWAVRQGIG